MTQPDKQHNHFTEIIQDIHKLTTFHGDLGLEYPQTKELDFLFDKQSASVKKQPALKETAQQNNKTPARQPRIPKNKPPVAPVSSQDIENCSKQINDCNSCPHHKPPKFGIGTTNHPFIFIICDRNSTDPSRPMEEAEESLLGKMLQAIKIRPGQVFVTNLIKCHIDDNNTQTLQEMAANCLSHTRQQIRLMQPAVICTMGELSSQTLLRDTNQLMALRGHFHTFMDIPLMATYHPAQLMALPELKKATWYDLQLMQRKLAMGAS
jgi:DNA polymerase